MNNQPIPKLEFEEPMPGVTGEAVEVLSPSKEQLNALQRQAEGVVGALREEGETGEGLDSAIADVMVQAVQEGDEPAAAAIGIEGMALGGDQDATADFSVSVLPVAVLVNALKIASPSDQEEVMREAINAVRGAESSTKISENSKKLNDYMDRNGQWGIDEFVLYLDMLPPIDSSTARRLADIVAVRQPSYLGELLAAEPSLVVDGEFMSSHFSHPERITQLFTSSPNIARAMAGLQIPNYGDVLRAYDRIVDEHKAIRLMHQVEVLENPNSTDLSRRMAHSMVRVAATTELSEVVNGAFGPDAFRPDQNKLLGIPIPLTSRLPQYGRGEVIVPEKPLDQINPDDLGFVLTTEFIENNKREDGTVDVDNASLADLLPEVQELLLAERLEKAEVESNDPATIDKTTQRNKSLAELGGKEDFFKAADLIHTTRIDAMDDILRNGLVCGELIGEKSMPDAFPFGVDFYKLRPTDSGNQFNIHNISSRIHLDSITLVVDRDAQSEVEYPDRVAMTGQTEDDNRHVVVLGALPSTELKAVMVHAEEPEQQAEYIERLSGEFVRKGMYLPIIDESGEVLFTPEEYDILLQDAEGLGSTASDVDHRSSLSDQTRDPIPPWDRPDSDDVDWLS